MSNAWGHSPMMVDAIYTMLLLICVSLMTIGFITLGRWCDEKLEALVRWWQMLDVRDRTEADVQAMLRKINGRR